MTVKKLVLKRENVNHIKINLADPEWVITLVTTHNALIDEILNFELPQNKFEENLRKINNLKHEIKRAQK